MKIYKLILLTFAIVLTACKSEQKDKSEEGINVVSEKNEIKLIGEEISYETDSTVMTGYIAHQEDLEEKRPGILVVHEWWGHNEFARTKADQLAELGYVAFAVDMYGQGKQAQHPEEAMEFSSNVMNNFDTAQKRFKAAMETLKANENVDPEKISAIGFCFGGSVALAMANTGVDLDAVAVFHSGLGLPVMPGEDLKAKLLIQNGAEDAMVTDEQIKNLKAQLDAVNADYKYIAYEGVKHSFTNKDADSIAKEYDLPLAYDKDAAMKSWERMAQFFEELYSN
ncbi:dienelactone hydrolase family protein [Psychroflexus sp. YR1-1]|uniref:Dienelactone hydrolase family protein n=1 Tax=Psychroflexus aurantiacus TaxID=2709310 RepID=A0A6B3QZ38_9FLAO|nr:dienelactone hydrolase family protein [Psychroflexus aurantiacus]NEV93573.1 dienelactone hydrolase family protein [Psychroflexus aurantiacus]